ncbi:MAG: SGNH/GDSL hydrolase family protein [Bacilli bacterium]|nr:SGNH/GDSL hydrolase family protein [Bacilli bacterium]
MKIIIKHKKLILLLIIIISVVLISKININNNISYTSLGDGYAEGIDSYGEINGYNKYLKKHLKENKKLNDYTNLSNKDMSINELYTNILINKNNIKQKLRESKIVTLSIGLNDLRYKLSITNNINDYKLNKIINDINIDINKLLTEISKYHKHLIYVIGYYYKDNDDIYLVKGIKRINKLYKKKNIIYIHDKSIQKNNKKYLINPNNIYLNKEGYNLLGLKLVKKLEK